MIELVTTAESFDQAVSLIDIGIDTLYIGNDDFGLRLPTSFSHQEIEEITTYAHKHDRRVNIAVNALMHNEQIKEIVPYLEFLASIHVDAITVGDPGVIHLLKKNNIPLPFIYDAQTMVTSANQVNFWTKRGSIGAVMARELTYTELASIQKQVTVPIEILVYGPTCIHQSKRPLVENYFNYTAGENKQLKKDALFLSEAKKEHTHYSIYEDINGTHVFASNDVHLLPQLDKLVQAGLTQWKLDGLFTTGTDFVSIAGLFVEARRAYENKEMTEELIEQLHHKLQTYHPQERGLDTGFFLKDPNDVK